MANTKSSIANIGEILGTLPAKFTFQNPPLIAAPNTAITDLSGNARQLPDPAQALRPSGGIERVLTKQLRLIVNEKGPNGEAVWGINGDDRIRFVGNWSVTSSTSGAFIHSTTSGDFFEVTWFGTGFNILTAYATISAATTYQLDGGSAVALSGLSGTSSFLEARNYAVNGVYPTTNLATVGRHTIRVNCLGVLKIYGVELLDESSQIKIPAGEAFANGKKYTNSALASIDYLSGFDGNPVLNGRGGHAVIYKRLNGVTGKVLQQTGSQGNFGSASHLDESVLHRPNFREFGASRSDDFSTIAGSSTTRAYVLDDGLTTLIGSAVFANTNLATEGLSFNAAASYFTLTFEGTGLDIFVALQAAGTFTTNVLIDGTSIGNFTNTDLVAGSFRYLKIVSGLPYGTHTAKFVSTAQTQNNIINHFVIYGPKKPTIPADAIELKSYYLTSTFVANTVGSPSTTSLDTISQGIMRKQGQREIVYNGTWSIGSVDATFPNGYSISSTTVGNYVEYTFWGIGFDLRMFMSTAGTGNVQLLLDGVATNFSGFTTTFAGPAGTSFTNTTGLIDGSASAGSGFASTTVNGLTLGKHTLRATILTTGMNMVAFDVISPIHFPNTKIGSLAMSPGIQLASDSGAVADVDLSKAKAWIVFDGTNGVIFASMNVSAMLRTTTGTYRVYFQKPFKNKDYVAVGAAQAGTDKLVHFGTPFADSITVLNIAGGPTEDNTRISAAFFGELEGEE